jgi:hypothetical protein
VVTVIDRRMNIVTRCTRFGNVPLVRASIDRPSDFDVLWWLLVDVGRSDEVPPHVLALASEPWVRVRFFAGRPGDMGHSYLNTAYRRMDGWIYNLDDDNLLHDRFYPGVLSALERTSALAVVFDQEVGGRDFSGLGTRPAGPGSMRVGSVDFGQAVFHRSMIGDLELEPDYYCADGLFLERMHARSPAEFAFVDETLCHYNALAGGPV